MGSKNAGFTLLELIITVSIAAILLSIGVPSFVNTIRTNRLATSTNELAAALLSARSESIKRNIPVILCSSSSGTSCDSPSGWEAGWIVYVDGNCSGTYDPAGTHPDPAGPCPASVAADTILAVHGAVQSGLWIRGNNNVANQVRFTSLGLNTSGMGALTVSFGGDLSNTSNIRVLCLGASGRSRVMPAGTASCPNGG